MSSTIEQTNKQDYGELLIITGLMVRLNGFSEKHYRLCKLDGYGYVFSDNNNQFTTVIQPCLYRELKTQLLSMITYLEIERW